MGTMSLGQVSKKFSFALRYITAIAMELHVNYLL